MGRINVLDKHIAELIAAGEVVERPSSVIKELVENSIDSGATAVTVEIKDGGITFMRVTDNGCGIMKDDIRNAFLRHATSKVKEQNDLDSIGTLGFRGEALASIAAVARVDLLTKAKEDEVGSHYVIEGCDEISFEDAGCPQGTTFVIRDIFYNVPARMKFLKKNVAEANSVAAVIDKIALSHSEIAFTFIRDNKQVLVTAGDGKLKNCIYSVYGREFTQSLVSVDYELNGVKVSGYVTKPQASRSSRAMQNFFINGRFVKSRTAMAALEEACKGMVMVGKFPGCVLHIGMSFDAVDVNVHPAKIEVRFVNEKPIFDAVYYGVKSAIAEKDTIKQFAMPVDDPSRLIDKSVVQKPYTMSQYTVEKIKAEPVIPPSKREGIDRKALSAYNEVLETTVKSDNGIAVNVQKSTQGFGKYGVVEVHNCEEVLSDYAAQQIVINTPKLEKRAEEKSQAYSSIDIRVDESETDFGGISPSVAKPVDAESVDIPVNCDCDNKLNKGEALHSQSEEFQEKTEELEQEEISGIIPNDTDKIRYIGEAFATYIIIEKNSEILLIDKHAAHERMIYEQLKREQGKKFAQYLLEPVAVTLSKPQYNGILEKLEVMSESGFEIDDFGQGTVLVRSAPSFIELSDIAPTVEEMADYILENRKDISSEYTDWLYHNIACRSAIKGGDLSSPEELIKLAERLDDDKSYRYCPHGRPTSIVITKRQIEKQFGRV